MTSKERALQESIEHWERIVKVLEEKNIIELLREGYRSNKCPLCSMYINDTGDDYTCHGCPVMDATGESGCRGTPWGKFAHHAEVESGHAIVDFEKLVDLARIELDFLKALVNRRMTMSKPTEGEVISSGTLRTGDLIVAYRDALKVYNPEKYNMFVEGTTAFNLVTITADELEDLLHETADDYYDENGNESYYTMQDEIVELSYDLTDALQEVAPKGCYFGAQEGDGACFGFWRIEE